MKASEAKVRAKTNLSTRVPQEQYDRVMTSINYLTTHTQRRCY